MHSVIIAHYGPCAVRVLLNTKVRAVCAVSFTLFISVCAVCAQYARSVCIVCAQCARSVCAGCAQVAQCVRSESNFVRSVRSVRSFFFSLRNTTHTFTRVSPLLFYYTVSPKMRWLIKITPPKVWIKYFNADFRI